MQFAAARSRMGATRIRPFRSHVSRTRVVPRQSIHSCQTRSFKGPSAGSSEEGLSHSVHCIRLQRNHSCESRSFKGAIDRFFGRRLESLVRAFGAPETSAESSTRARVIASTFDLISRPSRWPLGPQTGSRAGTSSHSANCIHLG